MSFFRLLIIVAWVTLAGSAVTRWLGCALVGVIGRSAWWLRDRPSDVGLFTMALIGAGAGLLAYAPLEYFLCYRPTTEDGKLIISWLDFLHMILFLAVIIPLVGGAVLFYPDMQ